MKKTACLLLILLSLASFPAVKAAPALSKGSYAQYSRVTSSFSTGVLNGTFRWDVRSVSEPAIANIVILNNQSSQILNFTLAIDLSSRIEIPSYTVASQNPSSSQPTAGSEHPTKTFFWIDPNPTLGSVIDTVLGAAIVTGAAKVTLHSGVVYNCWTLLSQTIGNTESRIKVNATIKFWYDQITGLLVKLDSEATGQFSKASDIFLLQRTNINSEFTPPLFLTAVEWASLTMSIIALILGGLAVAVAIDLTHFRRKKPKAG